MIHLHFKQVNEQVGKLTFPIWKNWNYVVSYIIK